MGICNQIATGCLAKHLSGVPADGSEVDSGRPHQICRALCALYQLATDGPLCFLWISDLVGLVRVRQAIPLTSSIPGMSGRDNLAGRLRSRRRSSNRGRIRHRWYAQPSRVPVKIGAWTGMSVWTYSRCRADFAAQIRIGEGSAASESVLSARRGRPAICGYWSWAGRS